MSGNRRHAGGMKSAMENLKRYDEQIAAAKAKEQDEPREKPCYRGNDWCPVDCCEHLFPKQSN